MTEQEEDEAYASMVEHEKAIRKQAIAVMFFLLVRGHYPKAHRGQDWTWWRGFRAFVALLIGRRPDYTRHNWYAGLTIASFAHEDLYAGWSAEFVYLHPECRADVEKDGDWCM